MGRRGLVETGEGRTNLADEPKRSAGVGYDLCPDAANPLIVVDGAFGLRTIMAPQRGSASTDVKKGKRRLGSPPFCGRA